MDSVRTDHTVRKPFIAHVHELQVRLTWSVLAVLICGVAAYFINEQLLTVIQRPLGQTLYYTSPTGGFNFLFKMCAVAGIILALPVLLYHLFKFLGPLLSKTHKLDIIAFTLWSMNLAYAGVLFAYFFSLPAALHFLGKFGGDNIQSLITADEYFNFALAYLAGFAVLFQLPLIILFVNRIKPLKPSKMMSAQRYVVLISFVLAAVLTPTPDPINQAIMAVPVVLLYQVSILFVWIINRSRRAAKPAKTVQRPVSAAPITPVSAIPASNYGISDYGVPAVRPLPTRRPVMADVIMR